MSVTSNRVTARIACGLAPSSASPETVCRETKGKAVGFVMGVSIVPYLSPARRKGSGPLSHSSRRTSPYAPACSTAWRAARLRQRAVAQISCQGSIRSVASPDGLLFAFDSGDERCELFVADDLAELAFGFAHPGGGPPECHVP